MKYLYRFFYFFLLFGIAFSTVTIFINIGLIDRWGSGMVIYIEYIFVAIYLLNLSFVIDAFFSRRYKAVVVKVLSSKDFSIRNCVLNRKIRRQFFLVRTSDNLFKIMSKSGMSKNMNDQVYYYYSALRERKKAKIFDLNKIFFDFLGSLSWLCIAITIRFGSWLYSTL